MCDEQIKTILRVTQMTSTKRSRSKPNSRRWLFDNKLVHEMKESDDGTIIVSSSESATAIVFLHGIIVFALRH
jgi:hypothetical protein